MNVKITLITARPSHRQSSACAGRGEKALRSCGAPPSGSRCLPSSCVVAWLSIAHFSAFPQKRICGMPAFPRGVSAPSGICRRPVHARLCGCPLRVLLSHSKAHMQKSRSICALNIPLTHATAQFARPVHRRLLEVRLRNAVFSEHRKYPSGTRRPVHARRCGFPSRTSSLHSKARLRNTIPSAHQEPPHPPPIARPRIPPIAALIPARHSCAEPSKYPMHPAFA